MTGSPGVVLERCQCTVAFVCATDTATDVGGDGTVPGTTLGLGTLALEAPWAFSATTVTV
jgi:hypothetical protein